ncbi:BON domain-containing protein [Cupriavidus sp. UYPR2.512]|uniref:BON domain-containing protein n=1 Tax=Cupriavidus sp. UYPR2.512 TaxID=1080187 RepID=UPI0012FB9788|nr:BON domain-containing protein [Cupriavidus sp. UYPR2.512]UIF90758.1 BON domain-containing protein [Cupriavidus necator]
MPANPRGMAATEADAALQAALCARLWDTGLDISEITLDVSQGRVTLNGAIGTPAQRDAVEACVRGCAGVGEIVNRIQVAPDRTGD